MDQASDVTLLLLDIKNGDPRAIEALIPIVYDELRRLAAHYLRDERAAMTLQPRTCPTGSAGRISSASQRI